MNDKMKHVRLIKLLVLMPFIIIIIALTVFSIWSITFGFTAGYIGLFIILTGMILSAGSGKIRYTVLIPVVWIIINAVMIGGTIKTYNAKRVEYFEKVEKNGELSFIEKFNVYGLNIVMSLLGYPVYPEVSVESFYIAFPSKNGVRYFHKDFFLESKKIRDALSVNPGKSEMLVRWSIDDYSLGSSEARFALALNSCFLKVKRSGTKTIYEAKVRVEYPMSSEVTLIKKPVEIKVEEGIFGYLQKAGWLHPYDAVWVAGE